MSRRNHPDPRAAPAINPRYLSHETDRRAAIGGLRFVRQLFAAPALAPYLVGEILPGRDVESDDALIGLPAPDRLDGVSRDLHLQDGPRPDGGGR